MHTSTIFSTSSVFHRFLISARTGSTWYHNKLSKKSGSDCTSWNIDSLMHSVFADSLTLSRDHGSCTQIHTISFYLAEVYPGWIHWWGVYAILLICWGISCLITLFNYTQSQHIAVVDTILLRCWTILIFGTLLSFIQSYHNVEVYLVLCFEIEI